MSITNPIKKEDILLIVVDEVRPSNFRIFFRLQMIPLKMKGSIL
ncbi:hypothetical protein NARC_130021 [Candidatus Nitrosocosmicus arcticus]|uniref:Uncharacterized protein n=1 Tax=Candidatus Nitrosocosmicus arcticus TaxID=2035267 RepID=A0A557SSV9_9ARCH|nr:hypothetical protein NARC_130021 [Candidatus Nitrosocosmicus arcticus]